MSAVNDTMVCIALFQLVVEEYAGACCLLCLPVSAAVYPDDRLLGIPSHNHDCDIQRIGSGRIIFVEEKLSVVNVHFRLPISPENAELSV